MSQHSPDIQQYQAHVRQYYESSTELYTAYLGTTIQSGVLAGHAGEYGPEAFRAHNLFLAGRAGIQPGHRVLDAGCGVCGPGLDIASGIAGVQVDGVTLSPLQQKIARERVASASMADRVRVHLGDYHRLPFADASFDVVLFLESAGYSHDQVALFREVRRVLAPGGTLYVKDVFARGDDLTRAERADLEEFDRVYVYRTRTMAATASAACSAGLLDARQNDLSPLLTPEPFHRAMVDWRAGEPRLNAFGEMHFRPFASLPIVFGEVLATR
jgi:cyclopropane fatty-acyl-phospholipid synthase-like methyltransferase